MGRDCPDRQRGQSWRNDAPGGRPQARIGGEADADYEVCFPAPLWVGYDDDGGHNH